MSLIDVSVATTGSAAGPTSDRIGHVAAWLRVIAFATIIARKPLSAEPHRITTRWSYVADVKPDAGAPTFRTAFDDPRTNGELISPAKGATVRVKCKPKSKEAKLERSDPSLSGRAQRR
jgi:hypothetical protein